VPVLRNVRLVVLNDFISCPPLRSLAPAFAG
jgi:hypothetical protein